jgi:hypothetical protein
LLLAFTIPVAVLGAAGLWLLWRPQGPLPGPLAAVEPATLFLFLLLASLLVVTAFALRLGDRIARPVTWLLRLVDAGPSRQLSGAAMPVADWEIDALSRRVQILLKQNRAGVRAVEELETLRREIAGVLDAAHTGRLDTAAGATGATTHPLTRRLLDFFDVHAEGLREASDGLTRLQGLLEQDWREETLSVEEIARRSERCFLEQTELAMELQRLARGARSGQESGEAAEDPLALLADLRLGLERWRREVAGALHGGAHRAGSPAGTAEIGQRMREWGRWIDESLDLLDRSVTGGEGGGAQDLDRWLPRLRKVAETASQAGQEMGYLSREAAQLQRTWQRLGERLRSMMVRVGEVHARPETVRTAPEGRGERDDSA